MYVANVIVHSDDDSLCKDHVTIVTSDMQYQHSVESFQLLIYTTVRFSKSHNFCIILHMYMSVIWFIHIKLLSTYACMW